MDIYAPKIRAAAADVFAIYEKYKKGTKKVPGIVKSLEHRLMYDQNCDPRPLPTDLRDYKRRSYKEFFGSLPEHDTELLESEYTEWLEARKKLSTSEKAMPLVRCCWSQPSMEAKYPRLASWHSDRPTSDVASESVCYNAIIYRGAPVVSQRGKCRRDSHGQSQYLS